MVVQQRVKQDLENNSFDIAQFKQKLLQDRDRQL